MRALEKLLMAIALMFLLVCSSAFAGSLEIDFSKAPGATLTFSPGGAFAFTSSSSSTFKIDSESGFEANTLIGLTGNIIGTFTIGTISADGLSAPVTASSNALFTINDGTSIFSAKLNWLEIFQTGSIGGLNTQAIVNISDFQYSGSNPDLLELVSKGEGVNSLSFTFGATTTLAKLKKNGATANVFSGTITAVPEPAFVLLLGLGIGAACAASWRFKS